MGAKKNEGSRDKHMSDISACSSRMRGKRTAIKEYGGPYGGHRAARPPRVKKILKVAIWETPGFLAILWIELKEIQNLQLGVHLLPFTYRFYLN